LENKSHSNYLYILIFVAAALRLYTLGSYGITADELSALQRTEFNSFSEMINGGVLIDFHPPLVQTFMYYWSMLFGTKEFAARFPFAVLAILSIYLYYQIAQKWFNKNVALLSAAAIACNQLMIIYSRLARPYAFGIFFTAAATLYFTKIIIDKKVDFKICAQYVFYSWCAMNTHYFSFLFIAVLGLSSLIFITKENAKAIILSGVAMLILFVPSFGILKHQLDAGGIGADSGGWLGVPEFQFTIDYVKYLFNGSRYVMFFYAALFIFLLVSKFKVQSSKLSDLNEVESKFQVSRFKIIAFVFFLFPLVFGYLYSYAKNPILQHSVLTFGTPFMFIFLFCFIPKQFSKKIISIAFASIIILVNSVTIFANDFYNTNFFGVYKPINSKTLEWETKYGKQNITHIINTDNPYFVNYYYKQWGKTVDYKGYNFVGRESLKKLIEIVEHSKTDYLSFAWTNIGNPLEITELIKVKFPYLIERKFFFNSEYYLFGKNKTEGSINDVLFSNFTDFNSGNNLFSGNEQTYKASEGMKHSRCIMLDEKNEFGPGIELNSKDILKAESNILNISLKVKKMDVDAKSAVVVVFKDADSTTSWQAMDTDIFTKDTTHWFTLFYSLRLPKTSKISDKVNVYFWNVGKKRILFDDVKIYTTVGNPILYSINNDF